MLELLIVVPLLLVSGVTAFVLLVLVTASRMD
jgi:hypothetical protein